MQIQIQNGTGRSDLFPVAKVGEITYLAQQCPEQSIMFRFSQKWGEQISPAALNPDKLSRNEQAILASYISFFGEITPEDYCKIYCEGWGEND